ncbi:hypothetical protein DM01DRAFT_1381498 [Hesseltinella vesiculosa]|uniref:CTLH domain-containing protein n=1 Tax=Hesseltinella vesiculosa TaxID=101127 RepID=A0A1X2GRD3_9FUNG|nr:hypothetical protein DM01DRAFT_1381498 [Hesseltinella vesiculosa]
MDPGVDNQCCDIILEYLIHSCYKDTARAFVQESKKLHSYCADPPAQGHLVLGHSTDTAWLMVDARKGDIPKAFDLIQKRFPGLLEDPGRLDNARASKVMFKLRCQQFIEIIRSSNEVEAIQYARQHLKYMSKDKEYQEMVTEVASLIAYDEPQHSNQAHLLSQDRRRQLADEVNGIVLAYCHLPEQTSVERIQRQFQVVNYELETLDSADDKQSSREKLSM